jgi:MFS family permease
MLMASLGTSIANVALPTLVQSFDASFQEAQWVVLAYLLASTTLIVSVGRLGDLTGRRRLLIAGVALFTVASALAGLAPTLWTLIAARAAQGLGAAILMALAMALVTQAAPSARTGSAMGLLGTMSAVGTSSPSPWASSRACWSTATSRSTGACRRPSEPPSTVAAPCCSLWLSRPTRWP